MRVAVVADLHVGVTSERAAGKLVESLRREDVSLIVLAGDLGEPLRRFEQALDFFASLGKPTAVLAGNHDVWHRSGPHTSKELWESKLVGAVRKRGYTWLEADILVRDDTAFVGTIAWYDYSARSPGYEGKSNEAFFKTKGAYNNDGTFIDWPWTDIEFAEFTARSFLERLESACGRAGVERVVVVTHVPIFPEQKISVRRWNTGGDAYYGNWSLGKRVEQFDKVQLVVSGHTHMGVIARHATSCGRVFPVVTIGSDYERPAYYVVDTDRLRNPPPSPAGDA